jgi:hypothetical protein
MFITPSHPSHLISRNGKLATRPRKRTNRPSNRRLRVTIIYDSVRSGGSICLYLPANHNIYSNISSLSLSVTSEILMEGKKRTTSAKNSVISIPRIYQMPIVIIFTKVSYLVEITGLAVVGRSTHLVLSSTPLLIHPAVGLP